MKIRFITRTSPPNRPGGDADRGALHARVPQHRSPVKREVTLPKEKAANRPPFSFPAYMSFLKRLVLAEQPGDLGNNDKGHIRGESGNKTEQHGFSPSVYDALNCTLSGYFAKNVP